MYKRKTFPAATIPTKCVKRKKRCLKWEVGRTLLSHLCPWWPTAAGPSSCKMLVLLHHWSNSARIQVVDPSKTNAGMGSFHSPAVTFHGGSLSKAAKTREHRCRVCGVEFCASCLMKDISMLGLLFPPDPKGSPTPLVPHRVLFSQYPAVISINCNFSFHHLAKIRNSKAFNLHWGLFCSNRLQTRAQTHYHMSFLITPNAVIKMKCGTAATFTAWMLKGDHHYC